MSNKLVGKGARRLLAVAALAVVSSAMAAPSANAGLLVKSAPNCPTQVFEQPFAGFGDMAYYTLVRGGSFESSMTGWQLSRARVVSGSNPYQVNGKGSRSLQISPGGVATSPTTCVGLEHPTMRFFVKSSGGLLGLLSTMTVEVLVETSVGLVVPVPIGLVLPNTKWRPSGRYLIVANLLPLLPDNYTPVGFRFRAIGGATWTIDDVYVDPMRRR